MRESVVENHLRKRVKQTGGMIRKVQWIGRRGAPDDLCGWEHTQRHGFVETKKPKTPLAERHQAREHARLRACGIRVDVLATIEAVDEYVSYMAKINIGQLRAL